MADTILYDAKGNPVQIDTSDEAVETVHEVEIVTEMPEIVEKVDPTIVTLSSGVRVRFKKLPDTVAQTLVTSIFQKTQLNKDGSIKDNLSTPDQIELAQNMQEYNSSIILWGGVQLVDELPPDDEWFDMLSLNPVVLKAHQNLDFNNKKHKEFLFIRYFAFQNESDYAMLSEKTIGNA